MTQSGAWHYDGKNAVRRDVELVGVGSRFTLNELEQRHGPFAFADLHYAGVQGDIAIYGLDGRDGWRLGLPPSVVAHYSEQLPAARKYGGWIDRIGLGPAIVAGALLSAAVIAVVLLSPQYLAPLIPFSVEKKLGDAMVGDFGGRFCHSPGGTKALQKLAHELDAGSADIDVEVAKIDMINAVALPGNKVIIFEGLMKKAESPDEIAGVLAHEMGHVREHHVLQALLRQLGLSVVLGGMDGGGMMGGLLGTTYTRDAEAAADRHSIKALADARISPMATAAFFDRMAKESGEASDKKSSTTAKRITALTAYISSHPLSKDRRAAFAKSIVKGRVYQSALNDQEWNDLKSMCTQDTKAKSGFDFTF